MMTVGELQARMGQDTKSSANVERVEIMRKQLVEQTLSDTDTVVNTMRMAGRKSLRIKREKRDSPNVRKTDRIASYICRNH